MTDKTMEYGGIDGLVSSQEPLAWVEINLKNLEHNITVIRQALPESCKIMAVVKADAYGHGIHAVQTCLEENGIHAFAVATLEEAIELRQCGVTGELLILGYTPYVNIAALYQYKLTQTVVDAAYADELNRFGKPIKVHIKINTGMNRLGENYHHTDEIAAMFSYHNLKIEGIYTHLCVCDSLEESDVEFTKRQIRDFYQLLEQLQKRGISIPKIHIQSSYGVLNYTEVSCDYARIGIALYGVLSAPGNVRYPLDLRPVLSLKSTVALIRSIAPGEYVGYGRSFTAEREIKIAVVSIGYADGYPRNLSNNGHVLMRGIKAPIIGRICMDQLMVDITEIPAIQRGDVVTLIGKDGINVIMAEQVATNGGTITNELLCRLGQRLKKIVTY